MGYSLYFMSRLQIGTLEDFMIKYYISLLVLEADVENIADQYISLGTFRISSAHSVLWQVQEMTDSLVSWTRFCQVKDSRMWSEETE